MFPISSLPYHFRDYSVTFDYFFSPLTRVYTDYLQQKYEQQILYADSDKYDLYFPPRVDLVIRVTCRSDQNLPQSVLSEDIYKSITNQDEENPLPHILFQYMCEIVTIYASNHLSSPISSSFLNLSWVLMSNFSCFGHDHFVKSPPPYDRSKVQNPDYFIQIIKSEFV